MLFIIVETIEALAHLVRSISVSSIFLIPFLFNEMFQYGNDFSQFIFGNVVTSVYLVVKNNESRLLIL